MEGRSNLEAGRKHFEERVPTLHAEPCGGYPTHDWRWNAGRPFCVRCTLRFFGWKYEFTS